MFDEFTLGMGQTMTINGKLLKNMTDAEIQAWGESINLSQENINQHIELKNAVNGE